MFDVSFTELLLIGVVALVVLGPERLPKVARTVGHLLGRAQRYVADVKTDIQREIDLEEVNKLKKQMDDAAQSLQTSMRETAASIEQPLAEARDSLNEAGSSMESMFEQARREVTTSPLADADKAPIETAHTGDETKGIAEAGALQRPETDSDVAGEPAAAPDESSESPLYEVYERSPTSEEPRKTEPSGTPT